jgi:hypothetical protein
MHADAKQADFCTYLSAVLLGGLLLNALFGLWWADPLAALVMVRSSPGKESKHCAARAVRIGPFPRKMTVSF